MEVFFSKVRLKRFARARFTVTFIKIPDQYSSVTVASGLLLIEL
jgi:hypothetical protein